MEHMWTICDRGHGIECIRKEVLKNLLKLHSISSDWPKVIEKL